ncbi:hypothetical protein D3C81_1748660 [compost metagenome]
MIQLAQLGIAVGQLDEVAHAQIVDVAQRPTAEVGEADAEHRAHVHLGGAGYDAFLQAAHGFQA